VAAVAVHVADVDVVPARDCDAIILVDDDAVANRCVFATCQPKSVAVVRSRQALGPLVGRISGRVVQGNAVNVQIGAVADTETVDRVVLDVDIVDRALSSHILHLDKVVGLGSTSIAAESIPPGLAVAVKNCAPCCRNLNVLAADGDERVVGVGKLPERPSLERDLGSPLQRREIDGRLSGNGNAVENNIGAGRSRRWNGRISGHVASLRTRWWTLFACGLPDGGQGQ